MHKHNTDYLHFTTNHRRCHQINMLVLVPTSGKYKLILSRHVDISLEGIAGNCGYVANIIVLAQSLSYCKNPELNRVYAIFAHYGYGHLAHKMIIISTLIPFKIGTGENFWRRSHAYYLFSVHTSANLSVIAVFPLCTP